MRNDNHRWDPAQDIGQTPILGAQATLSVVHPKRQVLISGNTPTALSLAGLTSTSGWPEQAMGAPYGLRLRRDRILVVDGPALPDGWHDDLSLAVSDMTDGYGVIDIKGSAALNVLQRGTEFSPTLASPSVVRGFYGYSTLIYAFGEPNRYRMHVPRAHLAGLFALLSTFLEQIDT